MYNWTTSITTLADNLLSKELIKKGMKGELFARLLCILARDFHHMSVRKDWMKFPYAQSFSLRDFLKSLLGDQSLEKIMAYTPNTRMWRPCIGDLIFTA